MENNHIFYKVDNNRHGQRLDNAIMALNRSVPKSLIYRSIRKGLIRVNDVRAKQEYRLKAGDLIRYPAWTKTTHTPDITLNKAMLNLIKTSILYENDDVLVLNKPIGIPCQKGSKSPVCIHDYLSKIYPNVTWHLTHRLDKETSGVLLIAKNVASARWFSKQFSQGLARKRYWAVVDGIWQKKGWYKGSLPILKRNNQAYAVISDQGKDAVSYFKMIATSEKQSLLEVRIETGRTHQIRVHAKHIGFPLVGDKKYFIQSTDSFYLLHARSMKIVLPQQKHVSSFTAPLAPKIKQLLQHKKLLPS